MANISIEHVILTCLCLSIHKNVCVTVCTKNKVPKVILELLPYVGLCSIKDGHGCWTCSLCIIFVVM